jgi:hypothetical protein
MAAALGRLVGRTILVPGSAIDLAVFRIVLFALAMQASYSRLPQQMAELPSELRAMPTGSELVYGLVPPNATAAQVLTVVMIVVAGSALVGYRARFAASVWVISAVYVMGIPELYGKVNHNHHLIWLAAVLAASPCADALSVDAIRGGARGSTTRAISYGAALRSCWLVIGLLYFFAGLWTLATQGIGWASPGNLRPLLHGQWAAVDDFEPLARIDNWPAALVAIGLFTLVFELGFLFCIFTRAWAVAVIAGAAFHLGTYIVLSISFSTLLIAYVVFIPWARSLEPLKSVDVEERSSPSKALMGVTGVVVAGIAVFGAMHVVEGWPFAAYPTFASRFSATISSLTFEIRSTDGTVREASMDEVFAWVPDSRRGRLAGRLAQLSPGDRVAVFERIAGDIDLGADAEMILVHVEVTSTDPDERAVLDRRRLYEVPLVSG